MELEEKQKYFTIIGNYRSDVLQFVKEEFFKRGFIYTRNELQADVFWSRSFDTKIDNINAHQKVNWMPSMSCICRKDQLARNILRMKTIFGEESFDFWPLSYCLPNDLEALKIYFQKRDNKPEPFILKPPLAARCEKIKLVTSIEDIEKDIDWVKQNFPVAQRYVPNPYLIDGYKVTFRFYVVLTSLDPLRIYIFPDGLIRMCTEKYSYDLEAFKDIHKHLDSIDLNEVNRAKFEDNVKTDIPREGLRCDFRYLWDSWTKSGVNTALLWENIKEIAVKSFLSVEKVLSHWAVKKVKKRGCAFELLGYDILIDQNYKPWLLEINHTPSLAPHTNMENEVKKDMLSNLFDLVDIEGNDLKNICMITDNIMTQIDIIRTRRNSSNSPKKNIAPWTLSNKLIKERMSRTDVWTIVETELEQARRGKFELCFPSTNADKYMPYFTMFNRTKLLALWSHQKHTTNSFFYEKTLEV